uniref:Uncharacterized protein n=1 Tax=uncultured marine virus TaxID=186617 RepID=A0A0F7L5W9_9VIRU|nr:hypothetical protein [uncultured marine virus]
MLLRQVRDLGKPSSLLKVIPCVQKPLLYSFFFSPPLIKVFLLSNQPPQKETDLDK